MQAPPERTGGWWVSPAVPTLANLLLGVLWTFSTAGGWGEAGFCGDGADLDAACADRLRYAVLLSVPVAAWAAATAITAWARFHDRPHRLDVLLVRAAVLWVAAGAILFTGGLAVQA